MSAPAAGGRLRVLYVTPTLGTGGAERSVVDSVDALSDRGIDLVFAVREHRNRGAEGSLRISPEIAPTGTSTRQWIPVIREAIVRHRPDVVHTVLFAGDLAGRLAAIGTGVPVLSSIVNMSYEPARLADPNIRRWRLEGVRAIEAVGGRLLTQRFHALTQAVKDAAVQRLGLRADRIDVVPRARDPQRLGIRTLERRARVRSALGIDESTFLILTVGRQEYQKAQDDLLRALPAVARAVPGSRLVVAGRTGNATADLQKLESELAVSELVTWLGHRDDVGDLLAACDVFAFPSRFEGLGGAVIEALSLGCVIVAADIPPLREVLRGTDALLFRQGDARDLAATLVEARDPALAMKAAASGPAAVRERYAMDLVADQMAALYRDVARSAGR